jgi:NitT/TauT family transport system substrate-binding protein
MEALASADLMVARLVSGEAVMGMLPANVAAKIASTGKPLKLAAVSGGGMLSLLTTDPDLTSLGGLRGQQVEASGHGATPEYVFRRLLEAEGLNPDTDLQISFALAYPEIAQSLIAGRTRYALLPEPFATMARQGNPEVRALGDIRSQWTALTGAEDYTMTVFVVDGTIAAARPDLVRAVLQSLRDSVAWVQANPEGAGDLAEKYEMGLRAAVVRAAVPRSNYVYLDALEARPSLEALFQAFLEYAPDSIGGRLPGDDFYLDL